MSCPNPIHYIEVSACGPHEGFDVHYSTISIHRARSHHSYWVHTTADVLRGSRRYWRFIALLIAFSHRVFPGYFREKVTYVPNK